MGSSHSQVEPLNEETQTKRSRCYSLTLKECLALLIGTAIPVAIGIYTAITNEQIEQSAKRAADEQRAFDLKQAAAAYQQKLYKNFLDAVYTLHKDGELNHSADPWAFANARYRAVHHDFDTIRKAQVLQFLKQKQMIGRRNCISGCESKNIRDTITLSGLNFDNLSFISETDSLYQLNLSCVPFDQVSMRNVRFSHVNLNGATFTDSRLGGAQFEDSSLNCSSFNSVELVEVDFSRSTLYNARFNNSNLFKAKLTAQQREQARFENVTMPDGTMSESYTTTRPATNAINTITASLVTRVTKIETTASASNTMNTITAPLVTKVIDMETTASASNVTNTTTTPVTSNMRFLLLCENYTSGYL